MLTLTSPAATQLNSLLSASTECVDSVLRLVRRKGRFHFRVDSVRGDDVTFRCDERVVLAMDSLVAGQVSARTLGIREIEGKPRLRFSRT